MWPNYEAASPSALIHFTHCVNYKSLASTFTRCTSNNYKIPNYLLEHKNSTTYSDRVTICVNTHCMCVWLKTIIKDRKERHAYLHVTHKSWTKAATWSIHDTITPVNIVCLTEYRRRFQQLLTCAKVWNKTRAHKSRRNRTSVCCQHRQWHKDGDAGTSARTKGGEANLEARTLFPEKHLSAWQTQTERESFELNLFGWAAQRLILKNPGLATQIWLTRRRRVCNHLNALAAPEVLLRIQRTVLQLLRWWVEKKDKNFDLRLWLLEYRFTWFCFFPAHLKVTLRDKQIDKIVYGNGVGPTSFDWAVSIGTICAVHPKRREQSIRNQCALTLSSLHVSAKGKVTPAPKTEASKVFAA